MKNKTTNKETNWSNKVLVIALLVLLSVHPAKAQIFLDDESIIQRSWVSEELQLPFVPVLGLTTDQYVPVGGEAILLGLLGGAYLLANRKKIEHV